MTLTETRAREIAEEVVETQDRLCSVKLDSMDDSILGLKVSVIGLTEVVTKVDKTTALLEQRWKIFPILVGVLGVLSTILAIVGGLLALLQYFR